NAVAGMKPGDETTTIFTSDKGRIVDVVRLLELGDRMLIVSANADVTPTAAWLDKYTIMDDFRAEPHPGAIVLGLYGERSRDIVTEITGAAPPDSGRFMAHNIDGRDYCIVRDTRLIGAGGFLIIAEAELADIIRGKLHES